MDDESQYKRDLFAVPSEDPVPASWLARLAWFVQSMLKWLNRGWMAVLLVAIAIAGAAALSQLDAGLSAMHVPDAPSYDVRGLVGPTPLDLRDWEDATTTWCDWADEVTALDEGSATATALDSCDVRTGLGPRDVLLAHVVVDTVTIALAAPALLWMLLWRTWRRSSALDPDQQYVRQVLAIALFLPPLVLVADLAENVGIFFGGWAVMGDGGSASWLNVVLSAFSLVKWLAIVLVLAGLGIAGLALVRLPSTSLELQRVWRRIVALRAQVIVGLVVGVLLLLRNDLGAQVIDVILRWGDGNGQGWIAGAGLVFVTASVVLGGGLLLRDHDATPPGGSSLAGGWLVAASLVAGAAGVGVALWRTTLSWWLLPVGVGLLVFGALSWPRSVRGLSSADLVDTRPLPAVGHGGWLLVLLTALPGWIVGTLVIRAGVTLALEDSENASWFVFVILGVVGVGFGTGSGIAVRHWQQPSPWYLGAAVTRWGWLVGALLTGVAWWLLAWDAVENGPRVGSLGILLGFTFCLGWLVTTVSLLGNHWRTRGAITALGLRRMPVLTFFVAFAFIAAAIDDSYTFHDARLLEEEAPDPVQLTEAFTTWTRQTIPAASTPETLEHPVPMIFVASAGGGIRAAYWTSITLGCLLGERLPNVTEPDLCAEPVDRQNFFLASGISGGSLGLVTTFAVEEPISTSHLDHDFVAADLAQLLFVDAPNAWIRADDWRDRAEVLEVSWERELMSGDAQPLADAFLSQQRGAIGSGPILVLNGATVDDGCRVNGSVLDTAVPASAERMTTTSGGLVVPPLVDDTCTSLTTLTGTNSDRASADNVDPSLTRSKDLIDLTCDQTGSTRYDLRLSTAALLSARFPFVSPSGGLYECPNGDDNSVTANERTYDVDGGVLESSGARTVEEIFTAVAPLVRKYNDTGQRAAENRARNDALAAGMSEDEAEAAADDVTVGCIEPRLIMLDNGYRDTARPPPTERQPELLLPLSEANLAGQNASTAAQQDAAASIERFFAGTCKTPSDTATVAYLYPVEEPGLRAPLGWTLSSYTQHDLERQLGSRWNQAQLEIVRDWFRSS